MFNSPNIVLDQNKSKAKYPEAKVIVLDDNFNTSGPPGFVISITFIDTLTNYHLLHKLSENYLA